MHVTIAPRENANRSLVAVVLLAGVTLLGMIALLPSTEEKAAVLMAEQRYDKAVDLLEDLEERDGLNRYEMFMLTRLYLLSGRNESAIDLLERKVAATSDNEWAIQQLIELYRANRDFEGEVRMLQRRYGLDGNEDDYRRLLGLYRLAGRYNDERALLRAAADKGQASAADLERLARLDAGAVQNAKAVVWAAPKGSFAQFSALPPAEAPLPIAAAEVVLTPLPELGPSL
jgi:DNA-binding SARP family transcriptional activator